MTYKINGKTVTREEFLKNARGIDFSKPFPQISKDYEGYNCPITGKRVEGRKAHRENLEKHGCRLFETGEREDFIKNRERNLQIDNEKLVDSLCNKIADQF